MVATIRKSVQVFGQTVIAQIVNIGQQKKETNNWIFIIDSVQTFLGR